MKHLIYTFLMALVLVSCNASNQSSGQTSEAVKIDASPELVAQFNQELKTYFSAVNQKDWETVISFLNYELLNLVGAEEMISQMRRVDSVGMERKVTFTEISNLSKIVRHDSMDYYRVYYKGNVAYKLSGAMVEQFPIVKETIIMGYGKERVEVDSVQHVITVKGEESLIAVSPKGKHQWKYIEFSESERSNLSVFIPFEVLSKL